MAYLVLKSVVWLLRRIHGIFSCEESGVSVRREA